MLRDFVYAYRVLRKSPVSTAVIILALALGIGANASSFIGVNAILLHPFTYPNLDRIMTVWETLPRLRLERAGSSPANFSDLQTQSHTFQQLGAYRRWPVNITGADRPERVQATRVTPGFFRVLGMSARIGRTFADDDAE